MLHHLLAMQLGPAIAYGEEQAIGAFSNVQFETVYKRCFCLQ